VDLNEVDKRFNMLPYELALMNGRAEVAELLLQHGARKTELRPLDAFWAACLNADGDQVRSLLAQDPTLLTQLGSDRAELLNLAAEWNKFESIKLMVSLGFDINELKRTAAIHMAASSGNLELVKSLIELGADPLIKDEEFGGTPLGWAQYSGKTHVVEFLKSLESADSA